jgi:hypothetical protein
VHALEPVKLTVGTFVGRGYFTINSFLASIVRSRIASGSRPMTFWTASWGWERQDLKGAPSEKGQPRTLVMAEIPDPLRSDAICEP